MNGKWCLYIITHRSSQGFQCLEQGNTHILREIPDDPLCFLSRSRPPLPFLYFDILTNTLNCVRVILTSVSSSQAVSGSCGETGAAQPPGGWGGTLHSLATAVQFHVAATQFTRHSVMKTERGWLSMTGHTMVTHSRQTDSDSLCWCFNCISKATCSVPLWFQVFSLCL